MAKIKKIDKDNSEKEDQIKEKNPPSLKLRRAKKEYSGSRWAAFILLILTVLLGLWFYVDGLGGFNGLTKGVGGAFKGIGWEKRYTLEKE